MASLENRNGRFRLIFQFNGQRHCFSMGNVSETEAMKWKHEAEQLLISVKRGIVKPQCPISKLLFHLGEPPLPPLTLEKLLDSYLDAAAFRLEKNSLRSLRINFKHLMDLLSPRIEVRHISFATLQQYVRKRFGRVDGKISRETVRKDIRALRTAWNWARYALGLKEEWPGVRIMFPKGTERLPFMTLEEAIRLLEGGEDRSDLFESVFLLAAEVVELLDYVKGQSLPPWVYPMFVFAAHTGARRSEMCRALCRDVNLADGVVLLREKKRCSTHYTSREVCLTSLLRQVLTPLLTTGGHLFQNQEGGSVEESSVRDYFHKALKGSRYSVLAGWHTFRHSFISALAGNGVDQRIIDDLVGHSTEEQRRRYRHLSRDLKTKAVRGIFDGDEPPAPATGDILPFRSKPGREAA